MTGWHILVDFIERYPIYSLTNETRMVSYVWLEIIRGMWLGGSDMNVVAHNLLAANANRQLGITTDQKKKSSERLSSGYRINRAAEMQQDYQYLKKCVIRSGD